MEVLLSLSCGVWLYVVAVYYRRDAMLCIGGRELV